MSVKNSTLRRLATHLLATLAILPALVPQDGEATLLSSNTLLLPQGGTEGARSDLGVLVVPVVRRAAR